MQNSYYSPKAKFILLTITMYMAGKVIQANVVFSLAIRARKIGPCLSCPPGISYFGAVRKFSWPCSNSLYWLSLFNQEGWLLSLLIFAYLLTSTLSLTTKNAKLNKERKKERKKNWTNVFNGHTIVKSCVLIMTFVLFFLLLLFFRLTQ